VKAKSKWFEGYFATAAGGPSEHNFWTSRVNPIKKYIFRILRLRAID
jgi:hypothetical protein